MKDKLEMFSLYFRELWFSRTGGLLMFFIGAFLGMMSGFWPTVIGGSLGTIMAFIVDYKLINYNYDGSYCPHCDGCGEVYCDGVFSFLENHVRGRTNCTEEDRFIDQIEELWEDYKKE